jgi:hypothetical protein
MRPRRSSIGVAAAVAAAVGACALATIAFAAASFSDPAGDNNASPDVTSVTVTDSAASILTITVQVANYQTLPENSWLNLWFDLDSNANTGADGDEALVQYFGDGGLRVFRWSGSELVRRTVAELSGSFVAGVLTVTAPKSMFDNSTTFGVLVVGSRAQDVGADEDLVASDFAPNSGRGRYAAPGPSSFTDAAGDHDAAPDMTRVRVADTKSGTITFTIETPSHGALSAGTWLELDIDVDRRRGTGDGGVDLYVHVSGGRVHVGRWNAGEREFAVLRNTAVRARNGDGVVTIDVPRRLLDDVAGFDFYFLSGDSAVDEEEDFAVDIAPDGESWWKYTLVNKAPLRLLAGAPRGIPARPRAGASFTIVLPVRRSDTSRGITSGTVSCNVRIQGQRVRASGRVTGGAARCSLVVPAGARGGVSGSMTVRSAGKSVATRFAFPIR